MSVAIAVPIANTHERLRETKRAPDGTAWADWSDAYAATREKRHSLLMSEGNLDDSITEYVEGDVAAAGSNMIYAAIQQFGGEDVDMDIPARPYLGIANEEAREIEHVVGFWLEGLIA